MCSSSTSMRHNRKNAQFGNTLNFGVHAIASLIPVHQNSVSVADARGQMKTADAPGLVTSLFGLSTKPIICQTRPVRCRGVGRAKLVPTKSVTMYREAGDKLDNRSGRDMRKSGKISRRTPTLTYLRSSAGGSSGRVLI